MAITDGDQLVDSMGNKTSRVIIDKASISNQTAGNFCSLWRATGQPGQGAVPSTAANCNNTTTGGINFTQQTLPATSYIGYLESMTGNSAMTLELHDRLMHMGGLSGTSTSAQTVGIDFNGITADNMVARIGDSNYSDIQWWLEWYTDTGGTGVNITVAVTYNDGSTGNLTVLALAATRRASWATPLNSLIPAASSGKYIRGISTVTLSATTGTVGSFGVTATRPRASISTPMANYKIQAGWDTLGFPEVPNSSCLFPIVITSTTTSGTVRGGGKILHG
jgi:hypothetical protein